MKTINVVFEDKEIRKLEEHKGDRSWREYILFLLKNYEGDKNED